MCGPAIAIHQTFTLSSRLGPLGARDGVRSDGLRVGAEGAAARLARQWNRGDPVTIARCQTPAQAGSMVLALTLRPDERADAVTAIRPLRGATEAAIAATKQWEYETNGEATGWRSREKPKRHGHPAETAGDTTRKHARPTGSQRRSAPAGHWEARCAEVQWGQNERDENGRSEEDTGTNDDAIGR
jgi:hypothetical protein